MQFVYQYIFYLQLYIEPWLFGTKPKGDEMKELVIELSNSVMQLKDSVSTLEFTINSQKEQIDRIFLAEVRKNGTYILNIRSE